MKDIIIMIYQFIGAGSMFWLYMFNKTIHNFMYQYIPHIAIALLIGIIITKLTMEAKRWK